MLENSLKLRFFAGSEVPRSKISSLKALLFLSILKAFSFYFEYFKYKCKNILNATSRPVLASTAVNDTILYFASKSISEIESNLNSDLNRVTTWMKANQLTLNVKKSKFMLIGSNAHLSKVDSIVISSDGTPLEEVQSFLYLGIVVNKNLTWEDHLKRLRCKINKKLGLLRRIKSCLPISARVSFFNSFVLPLFDYF